MAGIRWSGCTGLHVAEPMPDAETLDWLPCYPLPMRNPERTCTICSPVSYEYGVVGGAYRIRRTDERGQLRETPPVPRTTAQEWWWLLLAGQAV